MDEQERDNLLEEYENLKLLIEFHATYKVIKDSREYTRMIDDILDRMNEIKAKLEKK